MEGSDRLSKISVRFGGNRFVDFFDGWKHFNNLLTHLRGPGRDQTTAASTNINSPITGIRVANSNRLLFKGKHRIRVGNATVRAVIKCKLIKK